MYKTSGMECKCTDKIHSMDMPCTINTIFSFLRLCLLPLSLSLSISSRWVFIFVSYVFISFFLSFLSFIVINIYALYMFILQVAMKISNHKFTCKTICMYEKIKKNKNTMNDQFYCIVYESKIYGQSFYLVYLIFNRQ